MRSTLEQIRPDAGSSFRLLLTPHLRDVFLWHYHPEYEVVYIAGASGTRHVGDHVSRYEGSDLVFIGPNVPHLNFDYGVATDYRKVVVQLTPDFLGDALRERPEFADIAALFERARGGIAFHAARSRRSDVSSCGSPPCPRSSASCCSCVHSSDSPRATNARLSAVRRSSACTTRTTTGSVSRR